MLEHGKKFVQHPEAATPPRTSGVPIDNASFAKNGMALKNFLPGDDGTAADYSAATSYVVPADHVAP